MAIIRCPRAAICPFPIKGLGDCPLSEASALKFAVGVYEIFSQQRIQKLCTLTLGPVFMVGTHESGPTALFMRGKKSFSVSLQRQ